MTKEVGECCEQPVRIAAHHGHLEVVRLLLEHETDIKVDVISKEGNTALMEVVHRIHKEIADELKVAEHNLEAREKDPHTNLATAIKEGHKEVLVQLLKAGAEIEAKGEGDWTALTMTAYWGHYEIVELLLAAGTDVEA